MKFSILCIRSTSGSIECKLNKLLGIQPFQVEYPIIYHSTSVELMIDKAWVSVAAQISDNIFLLQPQQSVKPTACLASPIVNSPTAEATTPTVHSRLVGTDFSSVLTQKCWTSVFLITDVWQTCQAGWKDHTHHLKMALLLGKLVSMDIITVATRKFKFV